MTCRTVTVAAAAAELGCSQTQVRDLVRRGVLPKVPHMGRRILIPRHVLDEMLGLDTSPAAGVRAGVITVSVAGSFS